MTNFGRQARLTCAAGYSAVEMMMAMGIFGVLSAMAVVQIGQARPGITGDGAMRVAMSQMRQARELAITQRRFMRVTFDVANNQVQVIREEVPGNALTTLSSVPFEGGVVYTLVAGVPDTPDAFGRNGAVDFGNAQLIRFGPEGTLVNQAGANLNGSIFLAMPNIKLSSRAITVLGSTGRIRGYRWDGAKWVLV
jgi:prepilin-type N-terminal cleavage/methylation domain-containing protein